MSVWSAITLTLVASACMNLGLVFQKKGLSARAGDSVGPSSARRRRVTISFEWYLGMALLIGGYGIYLFAVSARAAPISLLQPLFASGLLVVAFMAVAYLNEHLAVQEWVGVGLMLAGVILLGLSVEGNAARSGSVHGLRLFIFVSTTVVLALVMLWAQAWTVNPARMELFLGILAGLLLGTGYLNTKIVGIEWRTGRTVGVALAAACTTVGLIGGLFVLQVAFHRGRALVATAVNLVTNQVLVVTGGIVCLGERFPTKPVPFLARVGGLGGILFGIVLLARLSARTEGRDAGPASLRARETEPRRSPA